MANEEVIHYRIVNVDVISKSMAQRPAGDNIEKYFFDLQFQIKVLAENKIVIPIVSIKIRGEENEKKELASIEIACLFEVIDFEKFILMNDKGVYIIPPILESAITPIAISTSRGVMYSEFRGTHLNNAILPVIMMNSLKKNESENVKEKK